MEFYWFDYWCMPQAAFDDSKDAQGSLMHRDSKRDDRTESEKTEFDVMLKTVNTLYLGMEVLLVVDLTYAGRFWTQFEAWLSMQTMTPTGLCSTVHAPSNEKRYSVAGVLNAREMGATQLSILEQMWGTVTPEEAHEKLKGDDVTVTNQSDKTFQLKKIETINQAVILAHFAVMAQAEEAAEESGGALVAL